MAKFRSVEELVKQLRPVNPVYCYRKDSIKSATNWFNANFPGKEVLPGSTSVAPKLFLEETLSWFLMPNLLIKF